MDQEDEIEELKCEVRRWRLLDVRLSCHVKVTSKDSPATKVMDEFNQEIAKFTNTNENKT